MMTPLRSPCKGTIKAVPTKAGDILIVDQTILTFA